MGGTPMAIPMEIQQAKAAKTQSLSDMTDITNATTFQERMFERVRESLSELLTAEEAKALVEKAIEQSLFQQEKVYDSYNSRQTGVKPSRFELLVKEAVEPAIKIAVAEWLAKHHEEVKASIQGVVEQGIASTVVRVFQDEMRQPLWEMGSQLQQVVRKLGGIQ
jgi:TPP-dependent indolepyruvate ferredoxin oxidoreductase alpha subunit